MASDYPFKINGYVYSKGTKKGFLRMARMGIPRPPFSIENKIYKKLKGQVKKTAIKILKDFFAEAKMNGLCFKDKSLVTDKSEEETFNDLLNFFEEMGRQEREHNKFMNEMQLSAISNNLKERWAQEAELNNDFSDEGNDLEEALENYFKSDQEKVIKTLQKDFDEKHVRSSFSLDKEKVFKRNMDSLRKLYIDNSIERISGEQETLKRIFLQHLVDYASGLRNELNIQNLMNVIVKNGDNMARMFARDQMARFNKAVTLSQFNNAGVTKVKWVTSHDVRVRKSHKDLDGKIFDINDLPEEINDYNCRCGLVPVEYAD